MDMLVAPRTLANPRPVTLPVAGEQETRGQNERGAWWEGGCQGVEASEGGWKP